MIEVELPDGTVAEFPDGTPPEVMKQAIRKRLGAQQAAPQPAPEPSVGTSEDMARSTLAGIRQGAEGMAGAAGDMAKLNSSGYGWLAEKMGLGETGQMIARGAGRILSGPAGLISTSDVQQVTDKLAGKAYEPQTTAGKYARTVGQFIPGAAMGPGGIARRTAMSVIPGVASEAAGQATEGTAAEPYARAAGALAGGVASAGRATPKIPRPAAIPADELAAQASNLYAKAEQAGIVIKQPAAVKLAQNVEMVAGRINPNLRPNTAAIVDEAKAIASKPISLQELDEFRQTVGLAMKRAEPQDVRTLQRIKNVVDDFAENASPADFTGDPRGFGAIKEARALWARKAKTETLNDIISNAELQATGYENGLVIGMRALAKNKAKMKAFNPAEQQMIRDVAKRGSALGAMRAIGMLSPNSTFGGITTGMGIASGILPGLITSGVGAASKSMATRITQSKVDALQRAVSSGVAPKVGGGQINLDALVRMLLTAQSGQNSAIANTPLQQQN